MWNRQKGHPSVRHRTTRFPGCEKGNVLLQTVLGGHCPGYRELVMSHGAGDVTIQEGKVAECRRFNARVYQAVYGSKMQRRGRI